MVPAVWEPEMLPAAWTSLVAPAFTLPAHALEETLVTHKGETKVEVLLALGKDL